MTDRDIQFERILALSNKASRYLHYKYGCDLALAEEKVLDVWVEKKHNLSILLEDTGAGSSYIDKQIYFMFKDNARILLGIYQTRNEDGKRIWFSPYLNEEVEGYDTNLDDYVGMEEFEELKQKDIFYEHIEHFNLNKSEKIFIDLCFSGFNPNNDIDRLVFKEALNTESNGYVKTFFNRLCKKLEAESKRIGLR